MLIHPICIGHQRICNLGHSAKQNYKMVVVHAIAYSITMGLLAVGTPLPWEEAKKYADHVRTHGITQFLYTWNRLKDRQGDELFWGDEVSPPIYQWIIV